MLQIPRLETAQIRSTLKLAYIDSFSLLQPEERPKKYTTLLAIHGVGFNSAVFSTLIPHLPSNTRLLAYNQRSYRGSSPAFKGKEQGGSDTTARYLEDFLEFVQWCVRELGLTSKEQGGQVIVLGWSKGTVIPISLLALLNSCSDSKSSVPPFSSFLRYLSSSTLSLAQSLVSSHISSLILFEPPGSAFSRPPTRDFLTSMSSVLPPNDKNVTREEWALAFANWVGGYRESRNELEERQVLEKSRLEDFDEELLEEGWQWECVDHGFEWTLAGEKEDIRRVGELAVRGENGELGVGILYGSRTVEYFEETVEMIREWWTEDREVGRKKVIESVEGTNHFGFVHKPEEFMKALFDCFDKFS
ncbi:hypothetical protein JCM5350_002909 [Sporobolomyces pararoseus]